MNAPRKSHLTMAATILDHANREAIDTATLYLVARHVERVTAKAEAQPIPMRDFPMAHQKITLDNCWRTHLLRSCEARRLWRDMYRWMYVIRDSRADANKARTHLNLKWSLRDNTDPRDHKVNVIEESIDCDGVQSYSLHTIEPTLDAFYTLSDEIEAQAEGPSHLWVISPEEAAQFRPCTRDLALEAFEDGHPHVLYT